MRDDFAAQIGATPHLIWQILTKRIENFDKLAPWPRNAVPASVWIGLTCEDQEHFDRRWPKLCTIGASVRFISYEPAIGPLKLGNARPDWLICGGESGPGARFMEPDWARALRDECAAAGIAFFMKQMTSRGATPPRSTRQTVSNADARPPLHRDPRQ